MKLRIVNKKRFLISTSITLLTIAILLYLVMGMLINSLQSNLDDYDKVTIVVNQGDNLWKIAERYNDGEIDIRTHIDYIRYLNNLTDTDHIVVGQKLIIPTTSNKLIVGSK